MAIELKEKDDFCLVHEIEAFSNAGWFIAEHLSETLKEADENTRKHLSSINVLFAEINRKAKLLDV